MGSEGRRFKGVLFDLDGTLLDTTELVVRSFQYTLYPYLGRLVTFEEVYPYFGKPLREGLKAFAPDRADELLDVYRRYSEEHFDELVRLCPGVKEGLERMYQEGVRLGVVTSRVRDTSLYGLRLFGLEGFFQAIIALEDVDNHKPEPEPVLACLKALELRPEEALMVGDSPHDIAAARAAGVTAVAAGWSRVSKERLMLERPDFWADSMSDVVALVLGQKF